MQTKHGQFRVLIEHRAAIWLRRIIRKVLKPYVFISKYSMGDKAKFARKNQVENSVLPH